MPGSQNHLRESGTREADAYVEARLVGDVVPPTDDTYYLGDATHRFAGGYFGGNGIDVTPDSDVDADLITVGVTGGPREYWDESETRFSLTHGLLLPNNADLGIWNTAGDAVIPIVRVEDTTDVVRMLFESLADLSIWGYGTGTGRKLEVKGSLATAGVTTQDSPAFILRSNYWSDGAANVKWNVRHDHDMITAGATPKSQYKISMGLDASETLALTLENNNSVIDFLPSCTLTMPNNVAIRAKQADGTAQIIMAMGSDDELLVQNPIGLLRFQEGIAQDVAFFGGAAGTGKTIGVIATDASAGATTKDAPGFVWSGRYWNGSASTPYRMRADLDVTATTPAAQGLFKIGPSGSEATILTLENVNGTLGFSVFGVTPAVQAAHIANSAGDDATAVNAILVVLETLGFVATS